MVCQGTNSYIGTGSRLLWASTSKKTHMPKEGRTAYRLVNLQSHTVARYATETRVECCRMQLNMTPPLPVVNCKTTLWFDSSEAKMCHAYSKADLNV